MKLCLFGATGKVGRQLCEQALYAGHHVTALLRDPEKLNYYHSNLTIIKGDVLNPADVRFAMDRTDCVICTLGMPLFNKDGLRAKGTRIIVDEMAAQGPDRFICLSGFGAGDSYAHLPGFYRFILVPLLMRRLYADHNIQESYIRKSKLAWTIARPVSFESGAKTGKYHQGFTQPQKDWRFKISHGDVADFLLGQVEDDRFIHQAVALSS